MWVTAQSASVTEPGSLRSMMRSNTEKLPLPPIAILRGAMNFPGWHAGLRAADAALAPNMSPTETTRAILDGIKSIRSAYQERAPA
jgi:hypothetical protein